MLGMDITLAVLPQAFFSSGVPQYVIIDLGGHLDDLVMQLEVNRVVSHPGVTLPPGLATQPELFQSSPIISFDFAARL